ncbi:MAG TPA: hypothetical protein P5556_04450 [Candidatus Gastranaerophilales bacterium]|nr:hypothetical protein [Candidatus Gastranaerophilales bacterium]
METPKNKIILLILILLTSLNPVNKAFSLEEINKKLELKENYSHLLNFDEKILRYRIADKEAFEIEIMPDTFKQRNEMLIKPLKTTNTNLIVWTEKNIYNFDIKTSSGKNSAGFLNFNHEKKTPSKNASTVSAEYKIDLPPDLPNLKNANFLKEIKDFELDLPPGIN